MILELIDDLNWVAVGGSLLLAFVIGSVWFMPGVLGTYWARQVAQYSDASEVEVTKGASQPATLLGWIISIGINVLALALAVAAVGADSAQEGIVLGIIFSFGFGATFSSWPSIFARLPWEWWLVNNGAFLIMQCSAGAILAVWR